MCFDYIYKYMYIYIYIYCVTYIYIYIYIYTVTLDTVFSYTYLYVYITVYIYICMCTYSFLPVSWYTATIGPVMQWFRRWTHWSWVFSSCKAYFAAFGRCFSTYMTNNFKRVSPTSTSWTVEIAWCKGWPWWDPVHCGAGRDGIATDCGHLKDPKRDCGPKMERSDKKSLQWYHLQVSLKLEIRDAMVFIFHPLASGWFHGMRIATPEISGHTKCQDPAWCSDEKSWGGTARWHGSRYHGCRMCIQ